MSAHRKKLDRIEIPWEKKRVLTSEEAAHFLGYSPTTLRNWRLYKRGPKYIKDGHSVRYRVQDLREWEEERVIKPCA